MKVQVKFFGLYDVLLCLQLTPSSGLVDLRPNVQNGKEEGGSGGLCVINCCLQIVYL